MKLEELSQKMTGRTLLIALKASLRKLIRRENELSREEKREARRSSLEKLYLNPRSV
jgi:hypothetical protein